MQEYDANEIKKRMSLTASKLGEELAGLRTGRANPGLLENLMAEAYGNQTPVKQLASVNSTDSRTLLVSVWDASLVTAVEKAIADSSLGLSAASEGNSIRVRLPELTEERRHEIIRVAGKYAESAKVAVRNIRREGMESLRKAQKDGSLDEDSSKRMSDELQKITDSAVTEIDAQLAKKTEELGHI